MFFNADNTDSDFNARWSSQVAEEAAEEPCTALVPIRKMDFMITAFAGGEPLYTLEAASLPGAIQRAKSQIKQSEVLTRAMIVECKESRTRGVVQGGRWVRAS